MKWDDRYATDEWLFGTHPSEFLVTHGNLFTANDKVLAIGDGEGRNGVWLAKQGLDVTSLDISQNAVDKAMRLAKQQNVAIQASCQDIVNWDWPIQYFDAIVSIFVHLPPHDRHLINPSIIKALKPSGLFFLEAFDKSQIEYASGGPTELAMLYDEAEIKTEFSELEKLHLSTQETEVYKHDEPSARGCSVQFVGRKKAID